MELLRKGVSSRERAAALIIVLAFVVLLAGLTLAYFPRTTIDRRLAQSTPHNPETHSALLGGSRSHS